MARVFIREKLLSDGKASLILDYAVNGQRRKQTLKIYVDPKDQKSRNPFLRNAYDEAYKRAELVRLETEKRLINQEHDLPTAYDKRASFLDYLEKMAANRHHNWTTTCKHVRAYTKGQITFGNVTEEWIHAFQEYLRGKVEDGTARLYVTIVSNCLNQAVKHKLIPYNPGKNVDKLRVKEATPKYLTKDQVNLLEQNKEGIPAWLVNAFLFSCYTGLRLSDVEGLQWSELHANGTNAEGQEQLTIVKRQVKTGEIVRVPLSPKALAIVEGMRAAQTLPLQAASNVFRLKGRTATKRYIRRWREQNGLHFTYHSSRHTFGTGLQSAGVDINTTSKLMGHKSLTQTLIYARVVDQKRNEAIDKMAAYWNN